MKKIVTMLLVLGLVLAFAGCGEEEAAAPEITLQEVYEAGMNYAALLGDHESVYVQVTANGSLIKDDYLSKEYAYFYTGPEYMDMGFAYASFTTENAEYFCSDGIYARLVMLTREGVADAKARFAEEGERFFISSDVVSDAATIEEKDGSIIVTSTADMEQTALLGDGIVSCVETYTLDAKTREMTAVKTVYTFEDETVEEGIVTITRDTQMPEGAKAFLAYEQETENLRTVTIVSNPGAENEKTDTIQVPKGLAVAFSADYTIAESYGVYADAACTQLIEGELDTNEDVTVYIQWAE